MIIRRHEPTPDKRFSSRRCLGVRRIAATPVEPLDARVEAWTRLCAEAGDILNEAVERVSDFEYVNMGARARLVLHGFEKLGFVPGPVADLTRRPAVRVRRMPNLMPAARVAAVLLIFCAVAVHVSAVSM
jgi:hypothetical protein